MFRIYLVLVLYLPACAADDAGVIWSHIALPKAAPVLSEDFALEPSIRGQMEALLAGLGSDVFAERKAACITLDELMRTYGAHAIEVAQDSAFSVHPDPEVRWSIREAVAAVPESLLKQSFRSQMTEEAVTGLLEEGLKWEALEKLHLQGERAVRILLRLHLEGRVGVDTLYSLNAEHVIPLALELLPLQTEDYYRGLLLRLIDGVLVYTIKPGFSYTTISASTAGIRYLERHPEYAITIAGFLGDANPALRLLALRACQHGLISPEPAQLKALLADPVVEVADETLRVLGFLDVAQVPQPDAVEVEWLFSIGDALSQEEDMLAQVGAYYALRDLADRQALMLYSFLDIIQEGRARDALSFVLSLDVEGRLAYMQAGREENILHERPETITSIFKNRGHDLNGDYDSMGIDDLAPLVRRDLRWSPVTDVAAWQKAVDYGFVGLLPQLEALIPESPGLRSYQKRLAACSGPVAHKQPANAWYLAAGNQLRQSSLAVRTGAVRTLLTSGREGARALLEQVAVVSQEAPVNEAQLGFVLSLARFHPYTPDVLAEIPLSETILDRLAAPDPESDSAAPEDVAILLWRQLEAGAFEPHEHVLAQLGPEHLPLLLAWLPRHSYAAFFLAELDTESVCGSAFFRAMYHGGDDWKQDGFAAYYLARHSVDVAVPRMESYAKAFGEPCSVLAAFAGLLREPGENLTEPPRPASPLNPLNLPSMNDLRASLYRSLEDPKLLPNLRATRLEQFHVDLQAVLSTLETQIP